MENTLQRDSRLNYLDSIRGIAAAVVVIFHVIRVYNESFIQNSRVAMSSRGNALSYIFGKIEGGARDAVILFFVLSGFVLARSIRSKKTSYIPYCIKRIFRIYPALFAVISASYIIHRIIGYSHVAPGKWWADICNPDMTAKTFFKNILLWGTTNAHDLDVVIWSLVHEMRISLIFPLILLCITKYRLKGVSLLLMLSIISNVCVYKITGQFIYGFEEPTFVLSLFDSVYFIIFFAFGAYLAINSEIISTNLQKLSFLWKFLLLALFCYCLLKGNDSKAMFNDDIRGFGAVGIIAMTMSFNSWKKVLDHTLFVWLGRISYSLYLVHIPIMYLIYQTIGASWSLGETAVVILPVSLMIAEIMVLTIEFPMNKYGKRLARKISHRHIVA